MIHTCLAKASHGEFCPIFKTKINTFSLLVFPPSLTTPTFVVVLDTYFRMECSCSENAHVTKPRKA